MSLADEILSRLLLRGERAQLRSSTRAIQESFQDPTSPYWLQKLDDRDYCHSRFRAAQDVGAVKLKWSKHGGDDKPLEIVRLIDVGKLAQFIGAETIESAVARARTTLTPWLHLPRVAELIQAWLEMKKVRGFSASSASEFADALRVLDFLHSRPTEDQIVRSCSVTVFGNSKRIEELERPLDILTAESLAAPARHWSEVFGELGLVKEPQPFLIAGTGFLGLISGQECPIVKPFVGVANKTVTSYSGSPSWVLTIENLTTFHLASQFLDGGDGLIVFTGGMPSPSWCSAYRRILNSLPTGTAAYHWGDIDQGGFRIAAHIRKMCVEGRQFLPWLMDAREVDSISPQKVNENVQIAMAKYAEKSGWDHLASTMSAVSIEQEGVRIILPGIKNNSNIQLNDYS